MSTKSVAVKYGFPIKQYKTMTKEELLDLKKKCESIKQENLKKMDGIKQQYPKDVVLGWATVQPIMDAFHKSRSEEMPSDDEDANYLNDLAKETRRQLGDKWVDQFKKYNIDTDELDEENDDIDMIICGVVKALTEVYKMEYTEPEYAHVICDNCMVTCNPVNFPVLKDEEVVYRCPRCGSHRKG